MRGVTVAERPLDAALYPDADSELLLPGSLVFRKTAGPVDLNDHRNWWGCVPGVSWKRPGGKGTTINGRDTYPVVHITYEDREAYAARAGKELPTAQARRVALIASGSASTRAAVCASSQTGLPETESLPAAPKRARRKSAAPD